MNPREFKEKPEDLEIHLNRASRSILLRFLRRHFLVVFCSLFQHRFFDVFGRILEAFWSSKSVKNPLKIRWIFLGIFEWFLGGFLGSFLVDF